MNKILASTASMDSAIKLRDSIEKLLNLEPKTIQVTSNAGNCAGHNVIMRYGCSYGNLSKEPVWGNKNFSALCIDKLKTSMALGDLVTTPKFVNDSFPDKFPVLVRETLTGAQSAGINVCHNTAEFLKVWRDGYFWTRYYAHEIELRANVVFSSTGNKIRLYKKVPRTQGGDDVFVCGSNGSDNTHWVLKDPNTYPKAVAAINAITPKILELGGKFVGVDMIYPTELEKYVVLELNSGPWLTQTTSDWLAGIFVEDMKLNIPSITYPLTVGNYDGECAGFPIEDSNGDTFMYVENYGGGFGGGNKESKFALATLIVKALNSLKEQP